MEKLEYIDAHAHLSDEVYDDDIDEVIERLIEQHIIKVNLIAMDVTSLKISLEMKDKHPQLFDISVGLHPQEITQYHPEEIDELLGMFNDSRISCIGEIGLDYHWHPEEKDEQMKWFIQQIELANQAKKPIMIHSREALLDTYTILKEHRPEYGCILHAYSGSVEMAHEFIKLGCMISLGGVVTFKNARVPKDVATDIPLESLLTETDSPYLTPTPYRGKRNESSYVRFVAQEIAKLKGISVEAVTSQVKVNYQRIFKTI